MKYLFLFFAISLAGCGECDNNQYYQVKVKNSDSANAAMCHYEVVGLGHCTAWQSMQHIQFTDTCSKFSLSQIITKDVVNAYQNNSKANL